MNLLAFLSNLAGPDLIVILLIILVLFGAKRLPELARGMGQAMREFHKAKEDLTTELHHADKPAATNVTVASAEAPIAGPTSSRPLVPRTVNSDLERLA
jgi:sec-independent protein translocase protein TatA